MTELVHVEIAADLAVQPYQQVEGEIGGHPGGIVVGGLDHRRLLMQVDADQRQPVGAHRVAHGAQQVNGFIAIEIAQRRSGKERQSPSRRPARLRQAHRTGKVGAHRQHFDRGKAPFQPSHAVQQRRARDLDRGVSHRIIQSGQQQLRLAATAAAVLHHVQARAHHGGNIGQARFQQADLHPGQVVLRLVGDALEQLGAAGIVEILGRQPLGAGRQPRHHVGGNPLRGGLQVNQVGVGYDRCGQVHASRARRRPAICQRAWEGKKFR